MKSKNAGQDILLKWLRADYWDRHHKIPTLQELINETEDEDGL